MPWNFETFLRKATELGHPANFCKRVPADIQQALDFHSSHTFAEVSEHRLSWCKTWLKRAAQLDKAEKSEAATRHPSTAGKRIRLTKEILESLDYEDLGVLDLLENGSPLAGEVEASYVFQPCYRPCVTTLGQLEEDAYKRNCTCTCFMFVLRGFILFRGNHFGSKTYFCVSMLGIYFKKNNKQTAGFQYFLLAVVQFFH